MSPGRIDTRGSKARLYIVTHVRKMLEGAGLWARDHRFIDFPSLGDFLLLAGGGFC